MRSTKLTTFVATLAFLFVSANAAAWEKEVSIEYVLGDADSRLTAREAAYEALKVEAAKSAKTYVQTTQTLDNEEFVESIEVLGASMVKLEDAEETFLGDKGRNGVLVVSATAVIDESELEKRVSQLQSSSAKVRSLRALGSENERLRSELEILRLQLQNRKISPDELPELLDRQNKARQELENIGKQVNAVFERGTLIEMAGNTEKELSMIKGILTRQFIDIIRSYPYQASISKVQEINDAYEVFVDLKWSFKEQQYQMKQILDPFLTGYWRKDHLQIPTWANINNRGPHKFSDRIMDWLSNHEVVLNVQLGGVSKVIPIVLVREEGAGLGCSNAWSDAGSDVDRYERELCVILESSFSRIHGNNARPFPLKFVLSPQQAEAATGVDVTVHVRKPTKDALEPVL